MKGTIRHTLLACLALTALAACDERVPDLYSAPDGIYFNNRTAANIPVDTAAVSFVYQPDVQMMDIAVTVQSLGRQSDTDRPVDLRVHSDNAIEHVDYELITPAVMPAHTSAFDYVVRILRTEALRTELKTLWLELQPNDHFATLIDHNTTGNGQAADASVLTFRIDFSDYYSTPPVGWRAEYVGVFSERKLRLLWKLFKDIVDPSDYNTAGAIPFNRWIYIQREVGKYMLEQENILRGYQSGTVDPDALEDPNAEGDARRLLDFTPVAPEN
ncbi:MAG: DUF4843 domain-containing protein [Clostridium sp.]|nr:DUF4843 domain-containing protein [Clostridium sp.]